MPAQRKIKIVEELIDSFSRSTIVIGTEFTGLDVNTITALRSALRNDSVEFRVVKNNLANIAAQETGNPKISQLLSGSTALIVGYSDPLETAKLLNNYLETSRIPLTIHGAVLDGQVLSPSDLKSLATIPPKPILVAQLSGQLLSLVTRVVTTLNRPAQTLVSTANAPLQSLVTVMERHTLKQASGAN
jgi:large subunit ribosomal protein L10